MKLEQIEEIVEQGESNTVEFKKSTGLLNAIFNTICAFLNSEGGIVLVGVTDSGKIVGQEVSDKTRREIAGEIAKLEPSAQSQISISYVPVDNKNEVIAIKVELGSHKPYIFDGRPFHRVQSTSPRMSQHRYEQLIVERGQLNHAWEDQPANGYSIKLLDYEEIKRTIERGVRKNRIPTEALDESIEEILTNRFDLVSENKKIKNAAIVLFAKKMPSNFSQCSIKMARFRGTKDEGEFIDSQHFYGNAFQILNAADHFIMRHLPIASFFDEDKFERRDEPTLPILALREAFINSICHRDYSVHSSAIFLSIFDDRLELWNNGVLPSQLKIADLKKSHKSYPRNAKIAKIFYSRGLIETWGKGTEKMIRLCKEHNVPEPEFKEYSGGVGVLFKFKSPITTYLKKESIVKHELSIRQEAILEIIKKHLAINVRQIMTELENPPSRRMVLKDLNYLKQKQLIYVKGSTTSAVWVLKE